MQRAAGFEVTVEEPTPASDVTSDVSLERRVVPPSVVSRQLANPFLVPDFEVADVKRPRTGRLAGWELLGPLFRSFEYAGGGAPACMPLPDPSAVRAPEGMTLMAAPGAAGRRGRRGAPQLPARRRARPRQDRAGAAGRAGRRRLPAAVRGAQRRQDQLGPRGRALDPAPSGHRHPRRRQRHRRLRRHRGRQLRGARPPRRLARRPRLQGHGRRRGALHQEQVLPAQPARPAALRADPLAHREPAADGADRHPADQRPRGLPCDLAVPGLDRRPQAAGRG